MDQILKKVEHAKNIFREKLETLAKTNGLTKEMYVRFLSMQYHLTKGVQRPFMIVASNSQLARKRNLRKFLVNFAQEEEFHFEIAKADLKELGFEPLPCPLDTQLWWLYFDSTINERPFIRLGATCILENISEGSSDVLDKLIAESGFLNPKNLRFLIIHRHGPNLAHGAEIIDALKEADLSEHELKEVELGADVATTIYMRLMHWIVTGENLK